MSDNPEETAYYQRIIVMYMDLGKETVLQVLQNFVPQENVTEYLASPKIKTKLLELRNDKILNKTEYNLVTSSIPTPEKFDIALLVRLLINLFGDKLPPPHLGWNTRLQPLDVSLSADLLRIRDTRNKLAHRPNARLSKEEFEKIWNKLEAILLRITKHVGADSSSAMESKLKVYKEAPLEPLATTIQTYLDEITALNKDIMKLQQQVENLRVTTKEFHIYFKRPPERYVRYIKLLFEGGSLVMFSIMQRELKNGALKHCLQDKREELKMAVKDEKLQEQLFPSSNCIRDPSKWDIWLLATTILILYGDSISQAEKKNIQIIREARENYADSAVSSLDTDIYISIWTDLTNCLNKLAQNVDEETTRQVEDLIEKYKKKGQEEDTAESYINQLRSSGTCVKTLSDINKDNINKLDRLVGKMVKKGIKLKKDHVFEVKLETNCKNEDKKRKAEESLGRVCKEYCDDLNTSPELELIRRETNKLFRNISKIPDVQITGVINKCILIEIRCTSFCGIQGLISYILSQKFTDRVEGIITELCHMYDEVVAVFGNITLESIQEVLDDPCNAIDKESASGINIPITCSTAEGMQQVLSVLGDEDTANSLNQIADQLSLQVNETVTLKAFAVLDEFSAVFGETDSENSGSGNLSNEEEEAEDRFSSAKGKFLEGNNASEVDNSTKNDQSQILTGNESGSNEIVDDTDDDKNSIEKNHLGTEQGGEDEENDVASSKGNLADHQHFIPDKYSASAEETPIFTENENKSLEKLDEAAENKNTLKFENIHIGITQGGGSVSRGRSCEDEEIDVSPSMGKLTEHQQFNSDSSSATAEATPILTENENGSFEKVDDAVDIKSSIENIHLGTAQEGASVSRRSFEDIEEDVSSRKENLTEHQKFLTKNHSATNEEMPILTETKSVEIFEHAVYNDDPIKRIQQGTSQGDPGDSVSRRSRCEDQGNDVSSNKEKLTEQQQFILDSSSSTAEQTPILTGNESGSNEIVDDAVYDKNSIEKDHLGTEQGDPGDSVYRRRMCKDEEIDVSFSKGKLTEHQQFIPDSPSAQKLLLAENEDIRMEKAGDAISNKSSSENIHQGTAQGGEDEENTLSSSKGNLADHQHFIPDRYSASAEETPIFTENGNKSLEKLDDAAENKNTLKFENIHIGITQGGGSVSRGRSCEDEKIDVSPSMGKLTEHQQFNLDCSSATTEATPILTETENGSFEKVDDTVDIRSSIENIHLGTVQEGASVSSRRSFEDMEEDVSSRKENLTEHQKFLTENHSATNEEIPTWMEKEDESMGKAEDAVEIKYNIENIILGTAEDSYQQRSTESEQKQIHLEITGLEQLEKLTVSSVKFESITVCKIRHLVAPHEKYKTLTSSLSKAVNINSLILDNVICISPGCKGHDIELSYLETLQELTLINCRHLFLKRLNPARLESCEVNGSYPSKKQCSSLLRALSKAPLIKNITLENVRCTAHECEDNGDDETNACLVICEELKTSGANHNLESCEISSCDLSHEGLLSLSACISQAADLKELKLNMVKCVQTGCEGHDINLSNQENLQSLTLNYIDNLILSGISPNLESCEIRGCRLPHEGLTSMTSCIPYAMKLKELTLENVTCAGDDCKGHFIDLSSHKTLRALMLQNCKPQLTVKGLHGVDRLDSIEINACQFSHEQWQLLSSGLQRSNAHKVSAFSNSCTFDNCEGHSFYSSDKKQKLTPRLKMNAFIRPLKYLVKCALKQPNEV